MTAFMGDYVQAVAKVLQAGGASEPGMLAQSYIGMMDRLKMDILFSPAFTAEDARTRAQFAAELFMSGAMVTLEIAEADKTSDH